MDRENIRQLKIVAPDLNHRSFLKKFYRMQGIAESLSGREKRRRLPLFQCRINPAGEIDIISTHDQLLGKRRRPGLGRLLPASADYAVEIAAMARKVAEEMRAGRPGPVQY